MKRKLSLLMVLMMVISLVPMSAFAASDAAVSTQTVGSDSTFDVQIVVEPDDTLGFTTGGIFEIVLGPDASFPETTAVLDGNATGGDVVKRGSKVLEVSPAGAQTTFTITAEVELDGAEEGDQNIQIRNITANASNETLTYAIVVGDGDVIVRTLVSPRTVTRAGANTIASLEIRETSDDTFVNGETITLELPNDFSWGTILPADISGAVDVTPATADADTLVLEITGATGGIDRIILESAPINVNRDARTGMVEVKVSSDNNAFSSEYVEVAEYKDYNVVASVDEEKTIIAGHEEDGDEYEIEFTLEGNGDNSFLTNRDIKATVANGEVALRSTSIGDASRIEDEDGDLLATDVYVDEFYLIPDTDAEEIELSLYIKGDWNAGGEDLEITVEGAGVENQTVKLADILAPATISTEIDGKTVADVVLGLQEQAAPEITITETQEGSLKEGFYVIDFPDQRFNGVQIMDAEISVEGDIEADIEIEEDRIVIEIEEESREASEIMITAVVVTLDRTVPYGPLNARFAALVDDTDTLIVDMDDEDDEEEIVADIAYLNVVTAVQDERKQQTVFTIDSTTYMVGSETRTLDAAPFISMNRTMLPIGTVAELVGATVNYSPVSRTAVFTKDNLVVSMNLDTNVLLVNGSPVMMDSKPMIVNSRAFVPVVYVAQAFGIQNGTDIVYDAAQRTVTLFPEVQ